MCNYHYLSNYWNNVEQAKEYLKNKYFNAYWEKFEILYTPCYFGDSLMVAPNNVEVDCISFFRTRLRNEGKIVKSNLYQLNNTSGRISYLAEVPIAHNGEQIHLFIELYTRIFNDNNGYPELLLDEHEINRTINLNDYSFAIYNQKRLINSSGNYNYSMTWNTRLPAINRVVLMDKDGFELKRNKNEKLSTAKDTVGNMVPYAQRELESTKNFITGSIYKVTVDNTHPLAFGYDDTYYSLKLGNESYAFLNEGYNVGYITEPESVSGFSGETAQAALKNSIVFAEARKGNGSVVYMVDDVSFRSFWQHGKLFLANAVFFKYGSGAKVLCDNFAYVYC